MKRHLFPRKNRITGQGMTEYIIIVALIAIAAIAIMQTFGQSVRVQFGKITAELQGETYGGAAHQEVSTAKTGQRTLKTFNNNR